MGCAQRNLTDVCVCVRVWEGLSSFDEIVIRDPKPKLSLVMTNRIKFQICLDTYVFLNEHDFFYIEYLQTTQPANINEWFIHVFP